VSEPVTLHGYRLSVYTWIARAVLAAKAVQYTPIEVDPFAENLADSFRAISPFGRVPVLQHGALTIHETVAIARYVDAAFDGPSLTPSDPVAQARMAQVIAIVDNYGYWPMVRQVFVQRASPGLRGAPVDAAELANGLAASRTVLAALEAIAREGRVLNGRAVTLADYHLAPMVDYFARAPEGAEALSACPALSDWWAGARRLDALRATDPGPDAA
jgi:glutathione S-transferase